MKTAKEIWERLETLYDHKTLTNKIFLKERFFGFMMDKLKTLDYNHDQFKKINAYLSNLDKKVDQEDHAIILHKSSPESFNKLKITIKYRREELKLHFVVLSLKSWELNHKKFKKSRDINEGLFFRERSKKKNDVSKGRGKSKSKSKNRRNLRCFICHKKGHFKRNFLLRKGKNYDSDNKSTIYASIVEEGYESSDVLAIITKKCVNGWVLDSG